MKPSIVVIPTQGLCNRLRAIASAYILSQHYCSSFYMIWNPEECCRCEFKDLFENVFQTIDLQEVKKTKYVFNPNVHTEHMIRELSTESTQLDLDFIIIQGGHEFKDTNMDEERFVAEKTMFYKSLVCLPHIEDYVSSLTSRWNNSHQKIVGVHFREFVEKYDQADGRVFSTISPMESFLETMRQIHTNNPNIIFFVTSNSVKALGLFQDQFPPENLLIESDNEFSRNSVKGIQTALQSLLVLSRTQFIVGTRMSSFSDEACFFNLTTKLCVGNEMEYNEKYHCYGVSKSFGKTMVLNNVVDTIHFLCGRQFQKNHDNA
jgi:effector-binding domain-containing protein